jgi:hypothetical protein
MAYYADSRNAKWRNAGEKASEKQALGGDSRWGIKWRFKSTPSKCAEGNMNRDKASSCLIGTVFSIELAILASWYWQCPGTEPCL